MQASPILKQLRPGRTPVLFVGILAALLVIGMAAFFVLDSRSSDAPNAANPDATGRDLVQTYMALLAQKDVAGLEKFLSDGFLRQGAEGSFYTKRDYLKNLPRVGEYKISDVNARQDGDTLVVRWLVSVTEVIDGKALSGEPNPRLATFVWRDGQWKLLSHANFNVAVASAQP